MRKRIQFRLNFAGKQTDERENDLIIVEFEKARLALVVHYYHCSNHGFGLIHSFSALSLSLCDVKGCHGRWDLRAALQNYLYSG